MKAYLLNVLIGLDHVANTLIGGSSDITISASAGYARNNGKAWGCILCRILDWIETNHCSLAIVDDGRRIEAAEAALNLGDITNN